MTTDEELKERYLDIYNEINGNPKNRDEQKNPDVVATIRLCREAYGNGIDDGRSEAMKFCETTHAEIKAKARAEGIDAVEKELNKELNTERKEVDDKYEKEEDMSQRKYYDGIGVGLAHAQFKLLEALRRARENEKR